MRIRRKPWARPELEACPFYISKPESMAGHWCERFADTTAPLELELGCGKGFFICRKAANEQSVNFIALDLKSEVLALTKRNIESEYSSRGITVDNVLLSCRNVELIEPVFTPDDRIRRIYINFPNPWPKVKHHKRRLTHPRQLEHYRSFLPDGGEIILRTDDDELYEISHEYFTSCGFSIVVDSFDMYADGLNDDYVSEHERMFTQRELPIHYIKAIQLAR